MHIFLVNDDGVGSKGIWALAKAACQSGHRVSLCAPSAQQSAASQRITLTEPIYVTPYPAELPGVTAYAVTGTPTDCVRLGLLQLVREPVDVLVSGINDGENAGMAVHYSGTVGAAREGERNRVPSIAASIAFGATPAMLERFAAFVVSVAETYAAMPLPPSAILNINAPLREPGEWLPPVLAPVSDACYRDSYLRRESPRAGTYFWLEGGARTEAALPGTDLDMLKKGHITLSFLGNPVDYNALFADFPAGLAPEA